MWPTVRACGGSCQDGDTKGSGPIIMNIPIYLEFMVWRYHCRGGDGILEKNKSIILRSVEMVSLLRVVTILHISVVIPMRWLSG